MQKITSPSYEHALQLKKNLLLVSQYHLPSFEEGFLDDARHMHPMQSEVVVDRLSSGQGNPALQLPSVLTLLNGECCQAASPRTGQL